MTIRQSRRGILARRRGATSRSLGGNRDYNNATAYPTTFALPAPTSIPSGVAVAANANLQTAVNANAAGTTFILAAGTWTGSNTVITPKAGDRFFGQGAGVTILNGIAIRSASGINTVTVANLSIHGVTWDGFGAIDSDLNADSAQFWQVLNVESYGNFQGMNVGSGSTVTNNYVHGCSKTGFGGGANGSLIQYNAFCSNNPTSQADGGNKSGAVGNSPVASPAKYSLGGPSTVFANNYFADNGLAGYWSDVGGTGVQYLNNISVRNTMVGLMTEIDGGSNLISGNLIAGNGFRNVDWQDDGILLSSSGGDTVTNNWAWSNRNADIQMYYQARQSNEGNNTITNNVTSFAIQDFVASGSPPADHLSGNTVVSAATISPPTVVCGPQV
jgi:hypothetical protein